MSFDQTTNDIFGRFGKEIYPSKYMSDPNSLNFDPMEHYSCIVVGRGTKPDSWWLKQHDLSSTEHLPSSEGWLPCDRFGGAFADTSLFGDKLIPHLWMDFNILPALRFLPTGFLFRIVFDWSTWRYMNPCLPGVVNQWRRVLSNSGSLIFESGVCSLEYIENLKDYENQLIELSNIGNFVSHEFKNPTHMRVPICVSNYILKHAYQQICISTASTKSQMIYNPEKKPFAMPKSPLDRIRDKSRNISLIPNTPEESFSFHSFTLNTRKIIPANTSNSLAALNSILELFSDDRLMQIKSGDRFISVDERDSIVAFYLRDVVENMYEKLFCSDGTFQKMIVHVEEDYPIETNREIGRWIEICASAY
ncbi:hypothetical protein HK096_010200 [Nowakowskiella sp. JEL0078]|nr:hypothetical protein HK096_010200 [Nowakowskiella sp. JEL0078]